MRKQPDNPPKCKTKTACRLTYGSTFCQPIGWDPIFDGNGKLLNSDPSIYSSSVRCSACGGHWHKSTQGDKTTWRIVAEKVA